MKKRAKGFSDGPVPPEDDVPQSEDAPDSSTQSPSKEQGEEVTEGGETFSAYFKFVWEQHLNIKVFQLNV